VNRGFLADDPYRAPDGRLEANMVGARGCLYNCSFCGAAVSANPDITIRTRRPENIIEEMDALNAQGVTAFRFVDDLFLGYDRFIRRCMGAFTEAGIGEQHVWDATGRINILSRVEDGLLDVMAADGCREVALGVESGSERLLGYMGKRSTSWVCKWRRRWVEEGTECPLTDRRPLVTIVGHAQARGLLRRSRGSLRDRHSRRHRDIPT
jgi:anaerobic magnesium-protoporphyrin IX monomethyl ester cyclase